MLLFGHGERSITGYRLLDKNDLECLEAIVKSWFLAYTRCCTLSRGPMKRIKQKHHWGERDV